MLMVMTWVLLWAAVHGLIATTAKNRNGWGWAIGGAIGGPITLVVLCCLPRRTEEEVRQEREAIEREVREPAPMARWEWIGLAAVLGLMAIAFLVAVVGGM